LKLLSLAGFLGAGKTTVLLDLAARLTAGSVRRLAIIENEVGQVGVDDGVVRESGLPVREIYSGCICCSLRLDLLQTLLALEREYNPDLVILEPSGVASPLQVERAFLGYGGDLAGRFTLTVLDAVRLLALQNRSIPLITQSIECADLILLNKADALDEGNLRLLETEVQCTRPAVEVLRASALRGTGMAACCARIERFLASDPAPRTVRPAPSASAPPPAPDPAPTVVARDLACTAPADRPRDAWEAALASLLTGLAADLQGQGAPLIGHLKAVLRGEPGGYLLASLTDYGQTPEPRGRLPAYLRAATLRLNAIVYGMPRANLEPFVDRALAVFHRSLEA